MQRRHRATGYLLLTTDYRLLTTLIAAYCLLTAAYSLLTSHEPLLTSHYVLRTIAHPESHWLRLGWVLHESLGAVEECPPHESCALSSMCTGARMLFLLVSMMQPFMIISSRMKCA